MTLALLMILAQPAYPANPTVKQGISRDGGSSWAVEVTNGPGTAASPAAVNVLDAGVLNVNFPAQPLDVRVVNRAPTAKVNPITGAAKVDGSGSVQPVSANALPLPVGAAQEDGGNLAAIVRLLGALTNGQQIITVTAIPTPINPFLPRCNPVRRTNCQP